MIPIFRAKKLDSDEYVEGNLVEFDDEYFIVKDTEGCYLASDCFHYLHYNEIDPTTISIHFPDMIDSQGNKIFASLQEDGKGGDIMQDDEYFGIAKYKDCQFVVEYEDCIDNIDNGNFEVIGIQQ